MDTKSLTDLLNDLESDRVERKASASDMKKIRQAVCAFANDFPDYRQPGVIFVGVHDDGRCADLEITDNLLTTLGGIRDTGKILPLPMLEVSKQVINGCELAVVIVNPSSAPPVRFDGRTWIRVGPRRAVATIEEEQRLSEKRRAKNLPFDLQPVDSATLDDLDLTIFEQEYLPSALAPDILRENNRSVPQKLTSLRFTTPESYPLPTVLGLLTIGKNPRLHIPGFYVQFVRFAGNEFTDPILDQADISGSLRYLLTEIDLTLQRHISTALSILGQPTDIKKADYPIVTLQQLTRNAVMHRSYEYTNAPTRIYWFADRIEIHSPGGLFGQVNQQNFGQGAVTDYRNPNLASVMRDLGYVQRFGVGISLAQNELKNNGNPPAEFEINESSVLVIIRKAHS